MTDTPVAISNRPVPSPRPSILRSKSTTDVTTAAQGWKPANISFAPLPTIEARKRRSNRPIGLANRAEMLRRSRRQFEDQIDHEHYSSYDDDDDIPLPDLGKLVKVIWRSVSRASGKDKTKEPTQLPVPQNIAREDVQSATVSVKEDGAECGGVWIEDVSWTRPPEPLQDGVERESNRDTMSTIDSASSWDGDKSDAHALTKG